MPKVHVSDSTYHLLRSLAQTEQKSMSQIVAEAMEAAFWRKAEEGYQRLSADPKAWRDYQQEITLFETASFDGLAEYPYDEDGEGEAAGA